MEVLGKDATHNGLAQRGSMSINFRNVANRKHVPGTETAQNAMDQLSPTTMIDAR